jgi:hypothetical protein
MKLTTRTAFAISTLCFAIGCGGSQPAPEAPPPEPAPAPAPTPEAPAAAPSATAPAEPAPAASAAEPAKPSWSEMTKEQRKELMKTVVLPGMKTVFQELDAKAFADMTCVTCHGPGAKEGKFDMPNPKLPKLDPKDGFAKHMKKSPKVTKFMMEHVAPEMVKLLNVPPYDPKTNEGFGCMNCHTMAGK